MREKPILFKPEMVRAILSGQKTQTRRLHKGKPSRIEVGDILWVRETFCELDKHHWNDPTLRREAIENRYGYPRVNAFAYKAECGRESERCREELGYRWKPSIHMPRVAARLFLQVTAVRSESLHDITEADAIAEGMNTELLEQLLEPEASKISSDYERWLTNFKEGKHSLERYCSECVEDACKQKGEDWHVDGWNEEFERDSPNRCKTCNILLQHYLTTHGISEEVWHQLECPGPIGGDDAWILHNAIDNGDWDEYESEHRGDIALLCFQQYWDRINAKTCPWKSNPTVWVIEFEKVN